MTLPQNVKDAARSIDDSETVAATPHPDCNALVKIISVDDWQTIRACLLSQDAEIADLIGKRDFLLRHYNLAESRLAAADALLRDIKDWDVNQAQGAYLMVPLNLRKRIQAHLSENADVQP